MRMKLSNPFWSYWYRARRDVRELVGKHAPKIRTARPKPTGETCSHCGKPLSNLVALWTGDGWIFFWECDEHCGASECYVETWWPFLFGAWCSTNDLHRIGIEVL